MVESVIPAPDRYKGSYTVLQKYLKSKCPQKVYKPPSIKKLGIKLFFLCFMKIVVNFQLIHFRAVKCGYMSLSRVGQHLDTGETGTGRLQSQSILSPPPLHKMGQFRGLGARWANQLPRRSSFLVVAPTSRALHSRIYNNQV